MRNGLWIACLLLIARAAQAEPGVVLHQMHSFSAQSGVDTLRAYITATHVRIAHDGGDAILDLQNNRLVLLNRQAHTWRQMPLDEWEAAIRQAAEIETGKDANGEVVGAPNQPASPPTFEPIGVPSERAGYLCDRWGLYSRRELLPGEVDWVEQQIWVARDLTMPPGAYEAYDRATRAIDSIGLGALVQRPQGVVLASEIRVGSTEEHEKGGVEIERLIVYKVEKRNLVNVVFAIPDSYEPATSP